MQLGSSYTYAIQLLDPLGLGLLGLLGIPQTSAPLGLLGIACTAFGAQAVVDEQCTATNIYSCAEALVRLFCASANDYWLTIL